MISKAARISKWGHDDTLIVISFLMFVLEMIYILAMAAIKASILFCFLRIFPDRVFRRAVFATQMFNLLVALTWVILCCVQCQPISYAWNGWDGEHQGGCGVQSSSIGLIHVAFQIAIDLVMLVLPITQVYKLQMDFKKKLGVMAMFLVGIFCLRIQSLIQFHDALYQNPTLESVTAALWALVELGVGIVVACMPNVRHLLRVVSSKIAPAGKASISSSSSNGRNNSSDPQKGHLVFSGTRSINETITSKDDSIASPSKSSDV
ncbi:uncharacterized protein CTRU02_210897 [Colletotrichum truncatum]|uniref:Uncharacterized protein n=1 Tax=Colletotrichum truncatum TaxID=5467 RepID=A0ACC3YQ99_COLTU